MRELTEVIGVDRRTVERWRTWWRDSFTTTPFWNSAVRFNEGEFST
jgi:hypothetical protein